ncbi:MAG: DUF1385 domain-containing protein [Lachnospiraceae bacterium]|nr:DUF1385 domain-containing protein [Lachnospiraceae bacterium]
MKPSGIGGQAVIEGVMMKNKSNYALAVRKPDGDIEVSKDIYVGLGDKIALFRFPFFRGIASLIDSLSLGMKTLSYSASFYDEDNKDSLSEKKEADYESEADNSKSDDRVIEVFEWKDATESKETGKSRTIVKNGLQAPDNSDKKEKRESVAMALTMVLSVILAVGIFVVIPFVLSELFKGKVTSYGMRSLIEGIIRLVVFVIYIKLISLMQDIKRVFMYHGAEHKVINCIERGFDLNINNAKRQSKEHKRCGTSFLLYVVLISIIVFVFIKVDVVWLRLLLRVVLVPVIAGIAYEFIRFAGTSDNIIVNILSKPGLWLQGLTTKEPDEDMLEVAIASVEAVFDWKEYQSSGSRYGRRRKKGHDIEVTDDNVHSTVLDNEAEKNSDDDSDDILQALDRYFAMDDKNTNDSDTEANSEKDGNDKVPGRSDEKSEVKDSVDDLLEDDFFEDDRP